MRSAESVTEVKPACKAIMDFRACAAGVVAAAVALAEAAGDEHGGKNPNAVGFDG